MAKAIKTKKTFGSVQIDHFSPPVLDDTPKALNFHISFEEAMRLHLGLGQALAKLNSYDRSTTAGKRSAVNLCVYTKVGRITINEGSVRPEPKSKRGSLTVQHVLLNLAGDMVDHTVIAMASRGHDFGEGDRPLST